MTPSPTDELDARLDALEDQRPHHAPISGAEKAARVARLASLLEAARVDALVVEPGATLHYLCDLHWHVSERLFALVVLADGSSFWIAPAFEVQRATEEIAAAGAPSGPVVGWNEDEYAWAPLATALRERGVGRVAVEPQCRAFVHTHLAAALGAGAVLSGEPIVCALRGRKDEHELALLRTANELTQEAIAVVAEGLEPGITDHELGRRMRVAQERLGLTDVWVLPLIGPDAALPHGGPTGRALARGDWILVDTGGSFHGYQSDNTRTWCFDAEPDVDTLRAWHVVQDAQRAAFEALRPGATCRSVDAAARAVIDAGGYGTGYSAFSHRLGHGIGTEGHEAPFLDGGSEVVLEPGMTFSNEPGIYLPGRFGIRIEDIVAVTEEGADHFGSWQLVPTSPR